MDKETFKKTKRKLDIISKVLWTELSRATKKHKDIIITQKLLNMIENIDNVKCEFGDWCFPEVKKK